VDLDTAIGELILGRVSGTELDAGTRKGLEDGIMSGVTLFKDNACDLEQLVTLIDDVKKASWKKPAIVTVDQEGGAVQRFDGIITDLPSAMALGSLDEEAAQEIAAISAQELNLLGINCVLAPVLDVATNPRNPIIATRAYGSTPDLVARFGALTARTFLQHNVLPVGKHFPGHGDTSQDSHTDLPALPFDRERLDAVELSPFKSCISALPAVLTAHVWLTEFEKEPLPASLSARITTDLLRNSLGFDGLVFTDDMLMKAVDDRWGLAEGCVLALIAGNDQLLACTDADSVRAVHAAIKKAVKDGRISEEHILASMQRRARALQLIEPTADRAPERIEKLASLQAQNRRRSLEVSCRAISVLRGTVPDLRTAEETKPWVVIIPDHPRYRLELARSIAAALPDGKKLGVKEIRFGLDPSSEDIQRVVQETAGHHGILVTYKGLRNPGQIALGHALSTHLATRVTVATDVPEDALALPEWETAIATCDPSEQAMYALGTAFVHGTQPQARVHMTAI
jgi:beta-N-acetylhexosaminidase